MKNGPLRAQIIRFFSLRLSFIYIGIRYRLVRLGLRVLNVKNFDFDVRFYGLTYSGHSGNSIDFMVYFFGAYEAGILRKIKELANKGGIAWDVGANSGHHSLFFSTHFANVLAFEPYPKIAQVAASRFARNHANHIKLIPIALGEREETLPYFEPPDENLGMGSFSSEHSQMNRPSNLQLQVKTADQLFREMSLACPNFIKIDVESFELPVLKGMRETLKRCRPLVLVEYCERSAELKELAAQFPESYHFFRVKNQFVDPIQLLSLDLNQNTSCYVFAFPEKPSFANYPPPR